MLVKVVVFTLLLAFPFLQSYASDGCEGAQTQTDMNICSGQAYEKADKELNATYQKALKNLEGSNPQKIENFKEIQRTWIKFRDLNCHYASSLYEGGTIAALIYSECMRELTEQRTKQIPDLFAEWE